MSASLSNYIKILLLNFISARAASILGANSEWVCPPCLVPKGFLWDLSEVIYPLRTRNGTLRLIEKANACDTKQKAHSVLLEQSIRNIPVCVCLEGWQISKFHSRTHSSITSANILLSTAPSVQKPSIQFARVSGVNTYGKWSKRNIYQLQNFKYWMTSRCIFLEYVSLF